jgi:hypothetical protein
MSKSSTFDFAPSTPRHFIQEEHHSSLAESPATVLGAGDLFEDSDEEEAEKNHPEVHGHGHDTSQEPTVQSPERTRDAQRDGRKEKETQNATENRAFFASLVDAIRPNLSLLKRLANQESSSSHYQTDNSHSVSEYSPARPGEYYTPGSRRRWHTIKSSLHSPRSRYTHKRKEVWLRGQRRGASETEKQHPFLRWTLKARRFGWA